MQDSALLAAKVANLVDDAFPKVEVTIEVPRGGFIKRHPDGEIDFVSPVPCPFNYGSVTGSLAEDGDPLDAVVLGPKMGVGECCTVTTWQRVRFMDDGMVDDKLICGAEPPTESEYRSIRWFFTSYALAKRVLNLARGRRGATRFDGLVPLTE